MLHRRELFRQASWLIGGAITAPAALVLLHSCEKEDRRDFLPEYFTPEEAAFITAYVDTLLPTTDTPGGLDVNVDIFIDKLMAATAGETEEPSDIQIGIKEFDEGAMAKYGRNFAALNLEERSALFREAEDSSAPYSPQVWGVFVGEQLPITFYRSFKSMAVWAFLSSEKIGTEVLNYDPVPGEYNGDISLESVGGRAWSL